MKTYLDLTDDEMKRLHRTVMPFTKDKIVKVIRDYQADRSDPNIETRTVNGWTVTWWINDGSMEIDTELSFNVFEVVKVGKELGLSY